MFSDKRGMQIADCQQPRKTMLRYLLSHYAPIVGYVLLCDVNPKPDPCAGPSCAGHWGKFFEWPSAQSATPFYNEVKAVILRQGRRAYGQALANEADPQLPTPRGGPPGNRGPPARRTRAMPSALLPQVCPSMYMSPQRQHWRRAASQRLRLRSPGLRTPEVGMMMRTGGYPLRRIQKEKERLY